MAGETNSSGLWQRTLIWHVEQRTREKGLGNEPVRPVLSNQGYLFRGSLLCSVGISAHDELSCTPSTRWTIGATLRSCKVEHTYGFDRKKGTRIILCGLVAAPNLSTYIRMKSWCNTGTYIFRVLPRRC